MVSTWYRRLLGRLLHLANSSPPSMHRTEFYALKDLLLRRHGTLIGYAVQSFPGQVCFDCEGTGKEPVWGCYMDEDDQEQTCERCEGTGWWKQPLWVTLECWELAGYPFHRPAARLYERPEILDSPTGAAKLIQGRIEHRRYPYYLSREAFYWLALVYDRQLFWASWGRTACLGPKRTPMVILGTWLFGVRRLPAYTWECWQRWRARREPAMESEFEDFPF